MKSSSSEVSSKTPDSLPKGRLSSLILSGWGKLTCGGDRAARSCLSWKGVTVNCMLVANEARLSKKILKLTPSKIAWFVVKPIAKPPHLKDVSCEEINAISLVSN